ncbi:hypothetical protein F5Y16DRAFT_397604 [Xylariaceae sp. FL0255]|nr:hypothetical protein F5Y16DRAFT_397604 [Xylariaceae sp. FL0255]
MSTLAGTPRGITFQGGMVFKAQWLALVPTAQDESSGLESSSTDQFVIHKLPVLRVTISKKEGFINRRAEDYETLLSRARNLHIILYDTKYERGYQTNGEDVIHNILMHRKHLPELGAAVRSDLIDLRFASIRQDFPDSTRDAMLENVEKVFALRHQFSDGGIRRHFFKNEVKSIFATLDGLWANEHRGASNSIKHRFTLNNVDGWEYMDVVKDVLYFDARMIEVQKKREPWGEYARGIKALVLFGSDFGDVLKPMPQMTYHTCISLPRDRDYLAIPVDAIEHLFEREGSLHDQLKLNTFGIHTFLQE